MVPDLDERGQVRQQSLDPESSVNLIKEPLLAGQGHQAAVDAVEEERVLGGVGPGELARLKRVAAIEVGAHGKTDLQQVKREVASASEGAVAELKAHLVGAGGQAQAHAGGGGDEPGAVTALEAHSEVAHGGLGLRPGRIEGRAGVALQGQLQGPKQRQADHGIAVEQGGGVDDIGRDKVRR